MDLSGIQRLVAKGESETLEFKKSTAELSRAGETLCGFLNASGGQVLMGVTPRGKIAGQHISDSTLRDVAATLHKFEPPAPIELDRVPVAAGTEVLVLTATPEGASVPFTFDGRAYQRVASTTSVMPQDRYRHLLLDRMHSQHRWENRPATGVTIEDLDREEILKTVRLGVETGRLAESTSLDTGDILARLGLAINGVILNAAVVVFSNRLLPYYPQCQLRMARFRGVDKSAFLDQRQIEGHTFVLLEEAMLFLRRHLPVAGRVLPDLFEREDEPLFPVAALREALVNALCHRDYSHPGGAVSLAVYDDRMEIWSDGTLPFGLQAADLKRDHPSRPRNPLVAGVFYDRGLVERWGRGTQKIVELCVRAGHPEPEFVEQAGAVGVRFLPAGYVAPHRVAHDLTDRQREILQVLSRVQRTAFRELRQQLSHAPADRTLRDDLLHLKRLGLICSDGRGRGARWTLGGPPGQRDKEEGGNRAGIGRE